MSWACDQTGLSSTQKLVLLMLASRTNNDAEECAPNHSELAADCGLGKTAIKSALAALQEAGLVVVTPRSNDGGSLTNNYQLLIGSEPAAPCSATPKGKKAAT